MKTKRTAALLASVTLLAIGLVACSDDESPIALPANDVSKSDVDHEHDVPSSQPDATSGGDADARVDDTQLPDADGPDAASNDATSNDATSNDAASNDDTSESVCQPRTLEIEGYYVAPNGSAQGNGSIEQPWDLTTAVAHPGAVKPGDTIWMRGGVYAQDATARLIGVENNFVTLRAYPNERPIIDGSLTIEGRWAIYRDLEVMSSDTKRTTTFSGSAPEDMGHRGRGVTIHGANTKLINSVIHNGSGAIGLWKNAVDAEIYGNITFNGGWIGPDRGHGHSLYTQNQNGTKRVLDNVMFNAFGRGVQAYGSGTAFVQGYLFEGNVHFNDEFLVGGESGNVAQDITIRNNYTYNSRIRMGFNNPEELNMVVRDNYIAHASTAPLHVQRWQSVEVSGNRIYGGTRVAWFRHPYTVTSHAWNQNAYFSSADASFEVQGTGQMSFGAWKSATGFDAASTIAALPSEPEVIVRPNAYEAGRAHLIIYNWPEHDSVQVDLSTSGLRIGEHFELRNAQNYFNESINGTYDGLPFTVPMNTWSVANPIGRDQPVEASTFPRFGAFIVVPVGCLL
ncbi:MAG: hypothetical protein H0U74_24035 [Bradymonadaceae bacterium]|nr:hypothetical protein [Lujinxingiaceae bacterium]